LLERRFADESFEAETNAPEEQLVRQRIAALKDYRLSKIDCHSTMCRIEVQADTINAAEVFSQLGLTEGGEIRRSEDGTFLIFAGRAGYPFQQVNRVN
jgi:hypothetical protein